MNVGSAVNLVVSTGVAQVAVPNVVGQTRAAATAAIQAGGLVVGTVTTASSSTVATGSVISESPSAGTQVNAGSAVSLVVSTGVAQVPVPNVVNQTQAAATTAIQSVGLVVGTVTTASSSTVASGSVISESPAAGTQVNPGSAVSLVVSSGPSTPSVVSVSPSSGVGLSQTFVGTYSDTGGAVALNQRLFVVSATQSGAANVCAIQSQSSGIYLLNDAGTVLLGPINASNSVSNSQCTLNGSGSSMTNSGNTSTLTLALTFNPAYAGAMNIYMYALDLNGTSSGWQAMGTFQIGAAVAVPNVVGQTQAAATTAIQSAGLVVGTVTTAASSTVASGNVISESPTAGTQVNAGSAVNLVVSTGVAQVAVPNVVGSDAGCGDDSDSDGRPGGGNSDHGIEQHGGLGQCDQ